MIPVKHFSYFLLFGLLLLSCEGNHVAKKHSPNRLTREYKRYTDGLKIITYKDGIRLNEVFFNNDGVMTQGESFWKNTNATCHMVLFDSLGRPVGPGDWNYYEQFSDLLYIKNSRYPCEFKVYEVESYQEHDVEIDTVHVYKKSGEYYINLNEVYSKRKKKFHYLQITSLAHVEPKLYYCFTDLVRVGKSIKIDKYNLNGLW